MPRYQPYPIYNFESGLRLDREPWLIPEDAFQSLNNAFFDRGILYKRNGYTEFGRLVHYIDDEALDTSVNETLTYSGTLDNVPIRTTDLTITDDGGPHETFTDNGDGTLTGDSGGTGTINYTSGAWSITYNSNPGAGLAITADYHWYAGLPITGITNFETSTGTREIVATDTKRLCVWDATDEEWDPVKDGDTNTYIDVWSGAETDLFSFANWADKLFIANNEDEPHTYDGTDVDDLVCDIDGGGNDIDTALLVKVNKGRLMFLRPTESGSLEPQRARWAAVGSYSDWTNDGYADAPGSSWIQGAAFLGDTLIVFTERETWKLEYTGYSDASDAGNPFIWTKISAQRGALSPFATLILENEIIGVGRGHIIGCDGVNCYAVDLKVPFITNDFDQEKIEICHGAVSKELNQAYITYTSSGETRNDSMLVIGTETRWWSRYDIGFNVIASCGEGSASPGMDSFDISGDEAEFAWDDRVVQAGFPLVLAGDHQGYVYRLNYGGTDNGSDIAFAVKTKELNPIVEKGRQVKLGKISLFVTRDENVHLTVNVYAEDDTVPYSETTIDCGSDRDISSEKVWKHIWVGGVANSHKIEITYSASNETPEIHAVVPYFAAAGPLK